MAEIVMIGGSNGAGKTTAAMTLLPEHLKLTEFVNADLIAAGLSPFNPDSTALLAGRLMLGRIRKLMEQGISFAFETTMATRMFSGLLTEARGRGYAVTTIFIHLDSTELALMRVADRVAKGGHSVPQDTVVRRFERGLRNFHEIYVPLSDRWYLHDNSGPVPALVAEGAGGQPPIVYDRDAWRAVGWGLCPTGASVLCQVGQRPHPTAAADPRKSVYLGIRRGVAKALAEHKRLGQSIVVWRDNQIVRIQPEEIRVPTDEEIERDYESLFGESPANGDGDPPA